jgi:hypothetical protein
MVLDGVPVGKVLEPAIVLIGAVAVGALVRRWWLTTLPGLVAVTWIGYAAASGGVDRDGMPVWQIALVLGGFGAAALTLALTAGIILGRCLRPRRDDRNARALLQ